MKAKFIIVLFLASMCLAAITNTYDTATPTGSQDPKDGDDRIREVKAAIQERQNDHNGETNEGDHYWPLTGTEVSDVDSGQHRMITLRQMAADPDAHTSYATTTDLGWLYQKNVSGNGEFFWEDEAENTIQMTSAGSLGSTSTNVSANVFTANGGITNAVAVLESTDAGCSIQLFDDGTTGGYASAINRTSDVLTLSANGGDNRLGTATDASTANDRQIADMGYVDDAHNWTPADMSGFSVWGSTTDAQYKVVHPNGLIEVRGYKYNPGSGDEAITMTGITSVFTAQSTNYQTAGESYHPQVKGISGNVVTFTVNNAPSGFFYSVWGK